MDEPPSTEVLFVAAANQAPVPIWVSNTGADRVFSNDAWVAFTGRAAGDELGEGWLDGVHADDRAACVAAHRTATSTREPFEVEYRLRRHDDRYRWMLEWAVPRHDDHGQFAGHLGSCVDITTQVESRVELERRERQQTAAADLGRRALEGLEVAEVLRRAARCVVEACDASAAVVFGTSGSDSASGLEARAVAFDPIGGDVTRPPFADDAFAREVFDGGDDAIVDDWRVDERTDTSSRAAAAGIRSTAAVTIGGPRHPFGVLVASSPAAGSFRPDDLQFLRTIANVIAAAVARSETELDLRAREAAARLALDVGGIGAWRWRPDTGEVFWSPELESIAGIDEGSFEGSLAAYFSFVHPDDRELSSRAIEQAAAIGGELRFEYRIVRRDGEVRWLQAIGRALPSVPGSDKEWIGVAIDVTARKEADADREQLLVREREAHGSAREANRRLGETLARLDTLLAQAPVGFGFLDLELTVRRANHVLAGVAGATPDEIIGRSISDVWPGWWSRLEPVFRSVAADHEAAAEVEVHDLAPTDPPVERESSVSVSPVLDAESTLLGFGVVVVDITERSRNMRTARLVAAATELVARAPDFERVVADAARVAIPEFADSCHVYLLSDARDPRRVGIAHADSDVERVLLDAEARYPLRPESHPVFAPILERGEPLLVRAVTEEMRDRVARTAGERKVLDVHGAVSCILAPLRIGDRVAGIISFAYTSISGRHYEDHDCELAGEIARRIALAVENARLARLADRATGRLDLLARTSELLTLELDSRVRVEALARVVLPTFADLCAVYLRDDTDRARLAAFAHVDRSIEARFNSVSEWPAVALGADTAPAVAMRENRVVILSEVADEDLDGLQLEGEVAGVARSLGVRSVLAVPLPGPGGPIGALGFGYVDSGRQYTDDDIPLALDLARRSGPTVDNALRYEHEQATVTALQRNLLPDRLPQVGGLSMAARYLPGSEGLKVGGDWYDVIPLPDGTVALAIGDVVGHGVRAAATMGRFRTALELCLLDGTDSPASTISRVNRYVTAANEAEMATLLVMLLRPETGEIRYASAGHLPPLVQSPDGSTRWLDASRGVPLGATELARSNEARDRLEPGDLLVLYTDGLVERRGESLDLGLERLVGALGRSSWPEWSPDAIADDLVGRLVGAPVRADDVALLVVGIAPEQAPPLDETFAADARVLRDLRSRLRSWLVRAGVDPGAVDEIILATNEISANAVEHAYDLADASFDLHASISGGVVSIVVADHGSWRPPRPDEHRGRGLDLARAFMDAVTIDTTDGGTVVSMSRAASVAGPGE
jgi:PAS domain S-box-containing protein